MAKIVGAKFRLKSRRIPSYPIGLFVRARLVSGQEIEAQITRIETTALGTHLHVEFGEEVANVTPKQIIGFYGFCFLNRRRASTRLRKL
jgi:hypothetical protein